MTNTEKNPAKVPLLPPKVDFGPLNKELVEAHSVIGELKGVMRIVPNPDLLIAPFRKREAVSSSAIEGTRATLEDVLEQEAVSDGTDRGDVADTYFQDVFEVRNYDRAMRIAMSDLGTRPIGENLLKKAHRVLLNSVRGDSKNPGEFRKIQVKVGNYIPPVHTEIPTLMGNWEKYVNTIDGVDPLIKAAIAHYQFEAIHPFADGNGRIGRLIIPLYLCQSGVLSVPILYVSRYFEQRKDEYQKLLNNIDINSDWIPWVKFFLVATKVQAEATIHKAKEIFDLYGSLKNGQVARLRSSFSVALLDLIFAKPIVSADDVYKHIQCESVTTAYVLLDKFTKAGILKKIKVNKKESVYRFEALMKLIRE
jgi:Fic family protein